MIKRIIAVILVCCITASGGMFVSASNLDDIRATITEASKEQVTPAESTGETTETEEEASGDTEEAAEIPETTETTPDASEEVPQKPDYGPSLGSMQAFIQPTDYLYQMFSQIIDLYVKEHLYEFTREEALEKFIFDMIAKQPVYFEFMLNTMLGTMDRYSSFHERNSGYMSVQTGTGYGIVVKDTGDAVVIDKVLKGTNAEAAGLLAGDKLVSIMGMDVTALPWTAVSVLLGSPHMFASTRDENGRYDNYNPEISVVVERNGEQHSFTLTKGVMSSDELTLNYYEEEQVAYIGITSFVSETLADDFKATLEQIKEKGYSKLIIDLRDNGGGSLDLVIAMVENFVNEGETMCYFNSKQLEEPEAVVSDTPNMEFEKISVLINENTASAAELMASILKNKSGAVLVGDTSFGKALGQTVYTLATGDYITITTYEVLDANGESYNETGLIPELAVDNVEMIYELPSLMIFNHINYKEITEGVYSDACMALEQRLELMGALRAKCVDGIWDENTRLAVLIFQRSYNIFTEGTLDDVTVTLITNIINGYKDDTYYDDSQLDVALIYHSSLSQAKRLITEKEDLAEEQQELIKAREERMDAEAEIADAN